MAMGHMPIKERNKERMKKLIIAAIAIVAAVAANAASVNWTVTGVTAPGSTTKTAGYIGYFFDEATISSATINAAILDGTFASVASSALWSAESNTTGVIAKTGLGSYGATATVDNPEIRNFYTVLFDANSYATAQKYIVTADVPVTFTSASGAKPAAFTNITASNQWADIAPEPTSGLLMLLGMGALALRRRRA